MRVLKFIVFAFVAIVATGLLFLIVGVPSGFLVDEIRNRFAAETGYQLQISGGAEFSIWPKPSVVVREITLVNPSDGAARSQLTIASARVEVELASLFSGKPKITDFVLDRPLLKMPLVRKATEPEAGAPAKPGTAAKSRPIPDFGRALVKDGTIQFVLSDGKVESRIDHIDMVATLTKPDHRLDINMSAKAGSQGLRITLKSKSSIENTDKPLPLELTAEAPGLLEGKLTSTAEVTSIGSLIKINALDGSIGKEHFTGFASVELISKPRVKVDLDFRRLSIAEIAPKPEDTTQPSSIDQPWSDQAIDLNGLNFVDAQIAISAAEFNVSTLRLAPVYIEGALIDGALNLAFSNTAGYGGKGDGILTLDVSGAVPRQTLHLNLSGVRALPLLSTVADFREIDGTMQTKIDVRARGASPHAIMSSLSGTVDVLFQDGQIRSVNIAQVARDLTKTTLNGWQQKQAEKTDLSELSALFKLDAGSAKTDNLKLYGPLIRVNGAGTADIGSKTLQFKLETKLVMSLEGQGGAADPVGFGVPVMVEGTWGAPKIYPDMAGILDNPDAAYAKLHELGLGLFGSKGGSGDNSLLKGLGDLFGPKKGESKDTPPPATGNKKDQPEATQPQDSKSQDAKSQDAKAQDTKTQDAKPQDAKPNDANVQDTKPGDSKPDDTEAKIKNILKDLFGK